MKLVPCDCGCKKTGDPRKMISVRKSNGRPRLHAGRLHIRANSWQVLPACVKPFILELRASQRCHATAQALTALPRWRRLSRLPRLWRLRRLSLQRRQGDKIAKQRAWLFILVTACARRLPANEPVK